MMMMMIEDDNDDDDDDDHGGGDDGDDDDDIDLVNITALMMFLNALNNCMKKHIIVLM